MSVFISGNGGSAKHNFVQINVGTAYLSIWMFDLAGPNLKSNLLPAANEVWGS